MKPTSSVSRSDLLVAVAAIGLLGGCAARTAPSVAWTSVETPAPGTQVKLEFANGSSRASMVVDLSATDLQLEMKSSGRKDSNAAPKAPATAPVPAPTQMSIPGTAPVAAAPERATSAAKPDSVTQEVVAGIRRAQDLFVRRQYAEALAAVDATIALRPTAEAQALAGSAAWSLGDREQARSRWSAALELDPNCPGVADALKRLNTNAETGKAATR